jgi:signal transduction histidine kinase
LELTDMIEKNIRKAAAQISAFRQVAVDQTGETPRRFAMSALIEEFHLSMKNELKKACVGMEIDCGETIVLTHFPGDIWRILANLLMNSLKHAYPHGGGGTVTIRVRLVDDSMEILYSDDGIGVPAGLSSQIFDPFYTTARDSGAIGLGLHLVWSIIVDRHGGSIGIDTAPGSGLSYRIVLPVDSPALHGGDSGEADERDDADYSSSS